MPRRAWNCARLPIRIRFRRPARKDRPHLECTDPWRESDQELCPPPERVGLYSLHPYLVDFGGEQRAEAVPAEPDGLAADLDAAQPGSSDAAFTRIEKLVCFTRYLLVMSLAAATMAGEWQLLRNSGGGMRNLRLRFFRRLRSGALRSPLLDAYSHAKSAI